MSFLGPAAADIGRSLPCIRAFFRCSSNMICSTALNFFTGWCAVPEPFTPPSPRSDPEEVSKADFFDAIARAFNFLGAASAGLAENMGLS
jgi:hypothetical protein